MTTPLQARDAQAEQIGGIRAENADKKRADA
jgi:hypothetical protein